MRRMGSIGLEDGLAFDLCIIDLLLAQFRSLLSTGNPKRERWQRHDVVSKGMRMDSGY